MGYVCHTATQHNVLYLWEGCWWLGLF